VSFSGAALSLDVLRLEAKSVIVNVDQPRFEQDPSPRQAMSNDALREYYEGLSDAAIHECFVAGPDDFDPAAWQIVQEQMELRAISAKPEERSAPIVEPRNAFAIPPRAAAEKRVEDGGTVALVLAVLVFVLGVYASRYLRYPARAVLLVCVVTLAYVTAGTLMRRRHSIWAAVTAEFLTVALYSPNLMYLMRHRMWGILALVLALYGPPIYWFWRAYRAALALRGYEQEASAVPMRAGS
jgi:hypothetical protein